MAQTKPKAGQFYGVSNNGTDGEFLQTDGTGGMAWASPITNPTITSIDYPGTQTAADPAGGESVIINGTLFASGITCTVGGTSAVTAFNSATQITITTPAKAAGPYAVAVLNPNGGTASENNFIQYSGVPVWSTAAGTLGNVMEGEAASFQVTATEGSDTIEYAVTTGTLPTGLSLATATGAITGTAPAVSADTTTTFSITATDDENQTSASRSFSITVQNDAPSNHFNTVLYTGNETSQNITGVGFNPDFVWMKNRSIASSHLIFDVQRSNNYLIPNSSDAQGSSSSNDVNLITDGFSLSGGGTGSNNNGDDFVSWNFKAGGAAVANTDGTINSDVSVNNTLGFSIASYTGNGIAGSTVGHGLDSTPEMVIVKSITSTANGSWSVYHISTGATKSIALEQATTPFTDIGYWNNTSPTASVFSLGTYAVANQSSANYIAYNFTSKPGFSKVGSYTGNGSASGPIVQTGFEPAMVIFKRTNGVASWRILDNKRFSGSNKSALIPNGNYAEQVGYIDVSFYANGFSINSNNTDFNASGGNYIYLAIAADGSTATPSLANSFATEIYTGNGGTQSVTTGFKPDFTWIKQRNITQNHRLFDSVRGATNILSSSNTDAQGTNSQTLTSFNSNGFSLGNNVAVNTNSGTYVAWNWKAGGTPSINTDGTITSIVSANQAAGFSVVKWTGTNAINTIGHGLSSAPELILIKSLDVAADWQVYAEPIGNNYKLALNTSGAKGSTSRFDSTSPTTSVFTFRDVGITGDQIAYCFTSISGYSKVGSYTSNNTSLTINVGFTPGLVLIKNIDTSGGSWNLFDSKRANGSSLWANTNKAEDDYSSLFQLNSTGFVVNGQNTNTNNLTDEFLYLAIKEN